MKCHLPNGCYNPNRCGDDGQCYWTAVHEVSEARRKASERDKIPDDAVLAFGCTLEASGHARCEKWCHLSDCPFALKESASSDTGQSQDVGLCV